MASSDSLPLPSSSSSSSSLSTFSASAIPSHHIATLIPVKLNRDNYLLWKSLFTPILQNADLYGLLDGSDQCPPQFLPTLESNPAYPTWVARDRTCKIWLHAAISESVLPYTVGCSSAQSLWDNLEKRFSAITRSHILQLKGQLQTLKKGSDPMMLYLEKIKALADGLAAAGAPLADLDLIAHILRGLPPEYDSFGTSIRVRSDPIDPDALHGLLISEEIEILQRDTLNPISNSSAPFQAFHTSVHFRPTSSRPSPGPNPPKYTSNPPLLPTPSTPPYLSQPNTFSHPSHNRFRQTPKIRCQICNKPNHTAIECRHRSNFAYQGRSPPARFTAMTATHSPPPSSSLWYADTGATNHVTPDLHNLSHQLPYQGNDKVLVGSGEGLPIANTGSSLGTPSLSWPH
ncbi:PREDICTED: uncharacterized protein LOC103331900 [Prunus mume]|uniref:Uncharacterized protein LOC103324184 n=1 Tax=Prunus mume TaxID=102107 RepID=A0ABM0NGH0_PRUMU|nr:PREDICTED: uncharacterized protein LOC103324184 [Prunus mume]XP_008232800.1 PREDICTED: uncharacterized protein LOC103331900 [Prunus mume]